uniref:Translation elongation factor IF5A C-terminal domain-containing protein n=1 Tax=Chromera velia CCMP2878 TaxID=1169474 RepID=A0A0G4HDQ5_9ALVE|mmetsp:Transcript_50935/g.100115  ORF Transcript_50935/g.100115 Transcript_50935/m.100115 type:complete len:190 (+) Transcript_50935:172-741(+)|eukprot:Cvel_26385.t1-p1 / transcript=Cvel_26385.t1 / gene=Cvel_26385 / organism=Chromera_velia_CCMP2878 / gene_product=hypothetical protein / transcript_product=hypothetical protein / location=Cvel_scaffold3128:18058-18624(+) / protein_length=189 / sequence_SO=supercontig / SO=protein_coding / is_pseudo=false
MEARVSQFLSDSQKPLDAKTLKEIDKLRKFLFKNQGYRFGDKEQGQLFEAVQTHASRLAASPEEAQRNAALQLVDDALKMPFNVFGTAHKKKLLNWYHKLTPDEKGGGKSTGDGEASRLHVDLIEISTSGTLTFMSADGETREVQADSLPESVDFKSVQEAFEKGMPVEAYIDPGTSAVISLEVTQQST